VTGTFEEARAGATKLRKEFAKLSQELQSARYVFLQTQLFSIPNCSPTHALVRSPFPGHTHQSREETPKKRVTLTRFDNELREFEHAIKKKRAVSDADLQLNIYELDM
jgi:hypothetical protein